MEKFNLLIFIEGEGRITYKGGYVPLKGRFIFIPAKMGDYSIVGQSKLIKTYI